MCRQLVTTPELDLLPAGGEWILAKQRQGPSPLDLDPELEGT